MNFQFGKNIFGQRIVVGGITSIENKLTEDKDIMQKKYSTILDWPIREDVPDKTKW